MRSLRVRLTAAAAAVMFIATVAVSVWLVSVVRTELTNGIERSIANEAIDFSADVAFVEDLEFARLPLDLGTLLVVIDEEGQILATNDDDVVAAEVTASLDLASVRIGDVLLGPLSLSSLAETEGEENMLAAVTPMEFLELDEQFDTVNADTTAWVIIARSLFEIDQAVEVLQRSLLAAVPVLTALVALLTWLLTGRALAPVERMRSDLDQITATSLEQRVSHPASNDEISRLGETMNGMLHRLEQSHVRQERFVADAAHELRTPLASMAAQLDVDARHPHTADPAVTATRVRSEVTRLQDLVESLLVIARTGRSAGPVGPDQAPVLAGNGAATQRAVDLDDLLTVSAHRLQREPHIGLTVHATSGLVASVDERSLERAVENLIANAFRHATARVDVGVTLSDSESHAVLSVDDDGAGIDPTDRERIFDRFVRLDEARSRDAGGTGLGLALARDVAEAHGGTLTAAESSLGGARFELRVPVLHGD